MIIKHMNFSVLIFALKAESGSQREAIPKFVRFSILNVLIIKFYGKILNPDRLTFIILKPYNRNDYRALLLLGLAPNFVGVAGFEPTTSSSRTTRATKLRYTPFFINHSFC
jgi:hypothetical protein